MVKKALGVSARDRARNPHQGRGLRAITTKAPADSEQLIADLQRQLAECRAERDEALEYQTATSDVLNVISRSTSDLQPVLDTLLATAARLCQAEMGLIALREGGVYPVASSFAFSVEFNEIARRLSFEPGRGSVTARAALESRVVHVADIAADPEYAMPEVVTIGKMRTALGVPLLRDGEPIGVLYLARQRVEPFTERQIELVRTFADQAVIAIENARLIAETREALEKQTATADILRVISRSPTDLQPTFDAIAASATTLCGAASGGVFRFDGSLIHFAAHYGWTDEELEAVHRAFPMAPGRGGVTARAIMTQQIVHVADIAEDLEYAAPSLARAGFHTVLAVPILRSGDPVGAITVTRHRNEPFSERQIELVRTFADQAVIAIENTRLLTELRESLEQQTATSEILSVISRSPTDVQPVFEAIVARAARVCEAEFSAVARFADGMLHLVALNNMSPEETAAFHSLFPRPPGRHFVMGRAFVDAQPVHFDDVLTWLDYDPHTVQVLQSVSGYRSFVAVPIFRESTPIGVIGCGRREVRPFTATQIDLVKAFADQAAIAL